MCFGLFWGYGGSPTKGAGSGGGGGSGKGAAGRSNWRYNNMRTGVISTAIPEANSEEDIVPPAPATTTKSVEREEPVRASGKAPDGESGGVVEEAISSFKENIFLKEDENNFMRGEVPRMTKSFAGFSTVDGRKDMAGGKLLQAARDQEAADEAASKQAALETAL